MNQQALPHFGLPTLGLFTWNVVENRVFGDDVFASFFGFEAVLVAEGVVIETVIDRIVEDDREDVARAFHDAILNGRFTSSIFRVRCKDEVRVIVWYGRCLQDIDGPTFFTGALVEHGALAGTAFQKQFSH